MRIIKLLTLISVVTLLVGCNVEVNSFPSDGSVDSDPITQSAGDTNTGTGTGTGTGTDIDIEDQETATVTLYWSAPQERINGDLMAETDIGGYEIRYRNSSNADYTTLLINDSSIDQHSIPDLNNADDYSFEVAVFDTDGIYSDFVVAMAN